ncbi:MAG: beta-ketoacyl synthase N-terminal-like domain-containing protein, partial [Isosphaeraceae bacterium]
VLLALKHRVKPATANYTRPAPRLGLEGSPFRVASAAEPWTTPTPHRPRRAALSGFGFGGINAHLLLEEWCRPAETATTAASTNLAEIAMPGPEPAVAVVGMAMHFGGARNLREFQRRFLSFEHPCSPGRSDHRWGLDGDEGGGATSPPASAAGHFLGPYRIGVDRFRIPPRELGEMLPQQSLMLKVAAEAIEDAAWAPELGPRTGVVVGLGLDQGTNDYQLRWWITAMAPRWNQAMGLGLAPAELERWIEELLASAGPPLSANRTMGSLGGVVPSRIAREFRIGGPCFSVSADEGSGIAAARLARGWLARGELDAVIVGAVDLAGDIRTVAARERMGHAGLAGEGAVAIVLKRLEKAVRDGDRVYAVLPGESLAAAEVNQRRGTDPTLA